MAKKKAPQRLAGAEESCISPEQEAIIQWFRTVKFRKNLLGGVDEAAMWKKLEELYALYEAASAPSAQGTMCCWKPLRQSLTALPPPLIGQRQRPPPVVNPGT